MVETQETNASKLSLLQRHREARELLVKIQSEPREPKEVSERRRPQSACSEVFGKRGSQSSERPKSAAPSFLGGTTSGTGRDAAAAANVHFCPVPNPLPNPLPPHLGGGSGSTSAPRKRPLSAFPSRAAVSQVGRRPASACGVRERFDNEVGFLIFAEKHAAFF